MNDIERVIACAKAEVGYLEKASNSSLDYPTANAGAGNYTKYARDLDAINGFYNGKKQGYAWCDVFVDWLFVQCFGADRARAMLYQPPLSAGAGCTYSLAYFRQNGALYFNNPKVGDQIFFGTVPASNHTGIVYAVDDRFVYTIEGNSGDGVRYRQYPINSPSIAGYGRPKWDSSTADVVSAPVVQTSPFTPSAPLVQKCTVSGVPLVKRNSNTKGSVIALQALLNAKMGIDLEVDGVFGQATETALRKFQTDNNLLVDAECGSNTWNKLLN